MAVKEVLSRKPYSQNQNTNCPFSLFLKYRKDETSEYPMVINLEWDHNHSVTALQSLSFKDIPDEVADTIKTMFDNGYTPAIAYREFVRKKREEHSDQLDLLMVMSDRSKVPRRPDFNKLYTDYNKEKFGTSNLKSMYEKLEEMVREKTSKSPEMKILYQTFDEETGEPFILVIITPLMLRVHEKTCKAAELVFIDSSGGMEEYNLRVFLIVTHSPIGALPLGIIITSDETTETLVRSFVMFRDALPNNAFFGRGNTGPDVTINR